MKLSDRDFFASQALYGLMLTSKKNPNEMTEHERDVICEKAVLWGDVMEASCAERKAPEADADRD